MNKNIIKWSLCGIAGLLAVMGLCFMWKCPIDCIYGSDSGVFFFKKQLLWNVIGIGLCFVAAKIPWQKWLKLAPWSMLAWFGLMVWAEGFSPARHGSYRWADLGFVCVNVRLLFVLAWALFTAWLCSKKCIKPWMVFAFVGVMIVFAGVQILGSASRLARFGILFGLQDGNSHFAYMQSQMGAAYATASWFGDADRSLRCLPVAYADAMPSAAALLFGKWFTLAVAVLFTVFGGILTWVRSSFRNPSKRMFLLFWGGAMVFWAMYSFFQSVSLVPIFGFSPALAGYGGALAVIFWMGLGVVLSILSDEEGTVKVSWLKAIVLSSGWIVILSLFVFGVMITSDWKLKFGTPLPRSGTFGEFGTLAKRGEILAADGSVLARTVKQYNIRLDPKVAEEYKIAFNLKSSTNICKRLKLTESELLKLCTFEKSRWVLVRSDVDESVAKWFLSSEGRRLAKGFMIETLQKREYPLGSNAVHVTGCVRHQAERLSGCTGVELICNPVLKGKDGEFVHDIGRAEQKRRGTPMHGGSVTTTVLPEFQNGLATVLAKAVATNHADSAWGIVMNATNGEIVAMASLPTYDPAAPRRIEDGLRYFMNYAVMSSFEPGHIMKPITYTVATDNEGVKFHTWMKRFGFGCKVAGNTVEGEEEGIVRPYEKTDHVTLKRLYGGRGYTVTGLQVANAYAILANGGKSVSPHLISKAVSANREEAIFMPENAPAQVVPEHTIKEISAMLSYDMEKAKKKFAVDFGGVDVAGMMAKAPLVENRAYSKTNFNVHAAGFFPVDKPRWVVAVGFTKPQPDHSPGRIALPAFAEAVRMIWSSAQK